jgi:hypothetical protein
MTCAKIKTERSARTAYLIDRIGQRSSVFVRLRVLYCSGRRPLLLIDAQRSGMKHPEISQKAIKKQKDRPLQCVQLLLLLLLPTPREQIKQKRLFAIEFDDEEILSPLWRARYLLRFQRLISKLDS